MRLRSELPRGRVLRMRPGLVRAFINLDAGYFDRLCGRIERSGHFDLRSDVGLNDHARPLEPTPIRICLGLDSSRLGM